MSIDTVRVHRTPGRLRIRHSALKRDQARARCLESCLAATLGVRSVQVNSLTGSLLAHFDPRQSSPEALLGIVSAHGVPLQRTEQDTTAGGRPRAADQTLLPGISRVGRKATRVACAYAGEKLLEFALEALVAAIL